jgi:hypothetical protein
MGAKGIKRSEILRWFQKCVELLRQEVPKDFFPEKQFSAKFSKSLKIQFICKNLPNARLQRKILLLLIPCMPNFEEIYFKLL